MTLPDSELLKSLDVCELANYFISEFGNERAMGTHSYSLCDPDQAFVDLFHRNKDRTFQMNKKTVPRIRHSAGLKADHDSSEPSIMPDLEKVRFLGFKFPYLRNPSSFRTFYIKGSKFSVIKIKNNPAQYRPTSKP